MLVESLSGGNTNLALATLITSGVGILIIGSAFVSKYLDKRKEIKERRTNERKNN